MNRDEVRSIARQAFDELVEAVEAGKSETLKEYLTAMGRFHNYSVGNAVLIYLQKPHATHVAGFRTWQRLGRHVKKGEHGAMLFSKAGTFLVPAYPVAEVHDPTGAGDSFAGGFFGRLASMAEHSEKAVREALLYGAVVASFGVEAFGLERFETLRKPEIRARFRELTAMIRLRP